MNKKNKTYVIGISCIGSGVGQSIINSLLLSQLPLRTVGFGTNPFAYGAYDCDTFDYTKNIYQEGFVDNLIEKCLEHKVDLVIPGLDDEALIYAQNMAKFEKAGIKALCAGEKIISICRDKERMSKELNKIVDVFVKSYDKNTFKTAIINKELDFPFIAKPRGGFASRGIEIIRSEDDLEKVTENHIVQELAIPNEDDPNYDYFMKEIARNINPQVSEISIQLVYSKKGELLGRMFSYNKLNNGVPVEIIPRDNSYVWGIIDKLTPALLKMGLRGPLNLQGRFTKNGLKIFEMNPRFTGITGLRALMGFNEVEACVKEWLDIDKGHNQIFLNHSRFGVRQTAEKSIPFERNKEVSGLFQKINGGMIKKKKTILVTGACGYLGRSLLSKLSQDNHFELWVFDLDKQKTKDLFENVASGIFDGRDIEFGHLHFGNIDVLLHLGFTRPHGINPLIADSLRFTANLFSNAVMHHVPAIINISSQSVYGLETPPLWTEKTQVSPSTPYAQAKYATELLLESLAKTNPVVKFSSIRLGALAGGAPGLVETDFLSKFVRRAIEKVPIKVIGGAQQMERLDIRDAVDAIVAMINSDPLIWKPAYNLGSGQTYQLIDIAKKVVSVTAEINSGISSEIMMDDGDINMMFGMDSSMFYEDIKWKPGFNIEDTIRSLVTYFTKNHADHDNESR
jgi:nucleoside-diphosphate-sugar epimerase